MGDKKNISLIIFWLMLASTEASLKCMKINQKPALSPRQKIEEEFLISFNEFNVRLFIGSDLSPAIADVGRILERNGANSSFSSEFLEQLADIKPYCVSNPNDTLKALIIDGVQKSEDNLKKLIKSQTGLENFDTDLRLSAMPELSEFYQEHQYFLNENNQIRANPSYSSDYLHNSNMSRNYARYSSLLIEASKIAQTLPITESCTNIVRLNSTSGAYLKSLCGIDTSAQYDAANTTCLNNNMRLLIIDTQEIHDSFVAAMTPYHQKYSTFYIRYWINGKKDTANQWFAYNPNPVAIYSGASWFNNDKTTGDSLTAFKPSTFNTVALAGTVPTESYFIFCEFN